MRIMRTACTRYSVFRKDGTLHQNYVLTVTNEWVLCVGRMELTIKNGRSWRNNCHFATLSNTKPILKDLGSNPGLSWERTEINRLSHAKQLSLWTETARKYDQSLHTLQSISKSIQKLRSISKSLNTLRSISKSLHTLRNTVRTFISYVTPVRAFMRYGTQYEPSYVTEHQ